MVAQLRPENDAARDQAGDLHELHRSLGSLHAHHIALVFHRRSGVQGVVEAATVVVDCRHPAGDRGAVDMNIEDRQKDADAGAVGAVGGQGIHRGHLAVGGGDDHAGAGGNLSFGVAEEVCGEGRQQPAGNRPSPPEQASGRGPRRGETQTIENAVANHRPQYSNRTCGAADGQCQETSTRRTTAALYRFVVRCSGRRCGHGTALASRTTYGLRGVGVKAHWLVLRLPPFGGALPHWRRRT